MCHSSLQENGSSMCWGITDPKLILARRRELYGEGLQEAEVDDPKSETGWIVHITQFGRTSLMHAASLYRV